MIDFYLVKARILAALPIVLAVFLTGFIIVIADTASTTVTVGNSAPSISEVSLNAGNDITLTENTFVNASTTITVSDANGCSQITSVTAQLAFASSTALATGETCSYNANTCYLPTGSCTATTTGNTCTGGADTSVEYDCGFAVWYPARPSGGSSPGLSAALWYVSATTTDGTATVSATNTAQTIDVVTLNALDVTSSIGFGSVSANADTGATNQSVTHTNTGNTALDNEISGDVMCTDYSTCSGGHFDPDQMKFGTSDVTYGSLTNTLAATSSAANISLVLGTTTATTSTVTDTTYWGIAIPSGQTSGSYTGQNTFTAVAD